MGWASARGSMLQYGVHHPNEQYHTLLGELYRQNKDVMLAVDQFRIAQRLNEHSRTVRRALTEIEQELNPQAAGNDGEDNDGEI